MRISIPMMGMNNTNRLSSFSPVLHYLIIGCVFITTVPLYVYVNARDSLVFKRLDYSVVQ